MPEEPTGLYNTHVLATDIRSYQPFNQQEASDREVILRQLETDRTCSTATRSRI